MAEDQSALEIHNKKIADMRAKILAQFPFETVIVPGAEAFAAWQDLKRGDRGAPVVIGNEDSFLRVAEAAVCGWDWRPLGLKTPAQCLDVANALRHPQHLRTMRKESEIRAIEFHKKLAKENPNFAVPTITEAGADLLYSPDRESYAVPMGEWPAEPPEEARLTVVYEYVLPPAKPLPAANAAGQPPRGRYEVSEKVWIVLIPAEDWTTIPAYLNWGGWNENPASEYHVAALRSWRDRYGAELAGMSGDVMNIRVARRPQTREEALGLAREHYDYCNDVIDQDVGSLSNLAAALMAHNWWYFWWD